VPLAKLALKKGQAARLQATEAGVGGGLGGARTLKARAPGVAPRGDGGQPFAGFGVGGLELGLSVRADRLPATSPLRATLMAALGSPGARGSGAEDEEFGEEAGGSLASPAPAAGLEDEAPPPPAVVARAIATAHGTPLPAGETFVQSLKLQAAHVGNLEAGGFLLLKKKATATAIYQLSVALGPSDVDPKDHCTLSLNGVTVVTHGDAAFSTLARFEHEFGIFKDILRSIPFFRRFRLWKQFTVWKKGVRRGKMATVAAALNQSIRFLPTMVPALSAVHGHCDHVENRRLIQGLPGLSGSGPQGAPFKLERFLAEQETVREALRGDLEAFYATVLQIVTEACDTTVNAFLAEMHIEADHPMTFMDRAALRAKLRRLTQFTRFVDLMAVASLRRLALESARDVAAAFSVEAVPQATTRRALDAYALAMAQAPVPPPPKDPKAKAKDAAAKAGDEAKQAKEEPKVPLRCADGEEDTLVIMASSVRFFDDLEVPY
jgi:hypothetical protein